MPALTILRGGKPDAALRTLFLQEMIERGVLVPYLAPSFSHGEPEKRFLLEAFDDAAPKLAQALEDDRVRESVRGAVVKPVFREIN